MAKATITIVGLGKRGTSLGLALNKPELEFRVVGHDKDNRAAKQARSMGAVDSTPWNLIAACEPADVVILAIPFDQVKETLKAIGSELRPGCVVLDTSPFKRAAMEWAVEYLGEGIHFVGIALGTNPETMFDQTPGPEGARADLFANSTCGIMPTQDCQPEAVKTAQDVARLLGADPYFLDPTEYDGISTAVNLMPALAAAALLGPATDSPGWREMRRLSPRSLLHFSQPLEAGGPALAQAVLSNKDSALHWLNATIEEFQSIRALVREENGAALAAQLGELLESRDDWLADWRLNRWERSAVSAEMPTSGSLFGQLFGFGKTRKGGSKQRPDRKK